jgi:hypothetical protein
MSKPDTVDPYGYQSILDHMMEALPVGVGGTVVRSILEEVAREQAEMYQLYRDCSIETCRPAELETRFGPARCDCGAATASTTHADWCSTRRPT